MGQKAAQPQPSLIPPSGLVSVGRPPAFAQSSVAGQPPLAQQYSSPQQMGTHANAAYNPNEPNVNLYNQLVEHERLRLHWQQQQFPQSALQSDQQRIAADQQRIAAHLQ